MHVSNHVGEGCTHQHSIVIHYKLDSIHIQKVDLQCAFDEVLVFQVSNVHMINVSPIQVQCPFDKDMA